MSERADAIDRAAAAYRALGELGETIEDEWQYVNDLVDAYAPSIEALSAGPEATTEQIAAVDEAIAEIGRIGDPHKAIDWLSTFPHVIALAVGGDVDGGELDTAAGGDSGAEDADDDNPFRVLLGGKR